MTGKRAPATAAIRSHVLQALAGALLLSACGGQDDNAGNVPPTASDTPAAASAAGQVIAQARRAMGVNGVTRLEYAGDGWEACLGQPWAIRDGWARWRIMNYDRVIDYGTFDSYQTALRQAGMDPDKLGGCGAQPNAPVQNQQSSVNDDASWEQQLQIYLTPIGFLNLAQANGARVERGDDGLSLVIDDIPVGDVHYRMVGDFGDDYLLDHITTWVDNSVYGDMAFEADFSEYLDIAGVTFPLHIVQKQGGFTTLDINVDSVAPGTRASAEPPPREGRGFGGGQAADGPEYEQIGEGVYALFGAYQSVLVEFDDYTVVLDGLQSDQRARDIIRIAHDIAPGKPVGYVLTTHAHFDHASGLREFVAEGATILTHESNVDFFSDALGTPRTLAPGETAGNDMPVKIMGVTGFFAIDDGNQRVEIHKINGSRHADDMLIAYIPGIKTIVEADLLQPWINPVFGGGRHPFLVHLASELERLGLDYEQFVPVHRPPDPPLMSRADLMQALGQN